MCYFCGNPLCKNGGLTITMSNKKVKMEPKSDDDELTDPETNPRIVGKDDTGTTIWRFDDDDHQYIRKEDLARRDRIMFAAKKLALESKATLTRQVRQQAAFYGVESEKYLELVCKFMDE